MERNKAIGVAVEAAVGEAMEAAVEEAVEAPVEAPVEAAVEEAVKPMSASEYVHINKESSNSGSTIFILYIFLHSKLGVLSQSTHVMGQLSIVYETNIVEF